MRLLHAADLHVGLHRYGWTLADQLGVLDGLAEAAEEHRPDAVLVAGDSFHTRRPSPEELLGFVRLVRRVSGTGAQVVVTGGNHDGPSVIGEADTAIGSALAATDMEGVHFLPTTSASLVETRSGMLHVLAVPYPHKRSLDADADPGLTAEERMDEVGRRVARFVRGAGEQLRDGADGAVLICVAHLSTAGARLGGERVMAPGWDVFVPPDAFAPFDYAALGHIHLQQQVAPNAWYAGAPEQHDFGDDPTAPRGWLLVDEVEEGIAPLVTPIPSRGRSLLTLGIRGVEALESLARGPDLAGGPGSAVRIVLEDADRVPDAPRRAVASWLERSGVTWHRIDVVRPERARTRADVAPDADAVGALRRYLGTRGLPEEPYVSAARALLEEDA